MKKIILKGVSFISGKNSHAALLSLFLYFSCSKQTQQHQKTAQQRDAFKLLRYFKLIKLKEESWWFDSQK